MQIVLPGLAHRAQDIATPVGLFADQRRIRGEFGSVSSSSTNSLLASFIVANGVPSSCAAAATTTAKIGQLLLARQSHLGGGQSVGHGVHFSCDAACVNRQEHHADDNRPPRTPRQTTVAFAAPSPPSCAGEYARRPQAKSLISPPRPATPWNAA